MTATQLQQLTDAMAHHIAALRSFADEARAAEDAATAAVGTCECPAHQRMREHLALIERLRGEVGRLTQQNQQLRRDNELLHARNEENERIIGWVDDALDRKPLPPEAATYLVPMAVAELTKTNHT